MNPIIKAIKNRRSIRKYKNNEISNDAITAILESARWSPSGLNNQPWKFSIIKDPMIKDNISKLTKYSSIIKECKICIAVFYNLPKGYNRDKDIMSIGAAIQNVLLTAHSLNFGAVWLGEILNKKDEFNKLLKINIDNELMALIALGHPDENPKKNREDLSEMLI